MARWAATSKYGAVRTEVDGYKFASKREAKRYSELKLLEKAGKIFGLTLQPRFPLYVFCPTRDPASVLVAHYVGDFQYVDADTRHIVTEDTKGVRTETYRLKKKMVEAIYGITITEV